ncbi:MAG: serine/threonine-protein kinase, partial [Acidobacteria bacterium]|nr:serine/threonine-protein kinase [Acidobacteriota bacterium]
MVGKTLGHYEILEPLGKGGMGEVYRARDTKLERDVAIKVLPEDFATDPDRLARFEREAKLLASLNHANIAAIYGLEDEGDQRFIVMEVVEGETLGERISRSGRIEVEEALEIARQIAEALEAAHESGVIHRDLKPANVKVTPDRKVKVLDFGLAKAFEAEGAASGVSADLSASPTMMAATQAGVILGTAAYMSPEQARGKPVDKRTDIWAFGCVLYEMLTGAQVFEGETATDILGAIVHREPDFGRLPPSTPASVVRLLRRCLAKEAGHRVRDAWDLRVEVAQALEEPEEVQVSPRAKAASVWLRVLPWVVAAAALLIAGLSFLSARGTPAGGAAGVMRFAMPAPDGTRLVSPPSISPDGSLIVFAAAPVGGTGSQLYLRRIGDDDPVPLAGIDFAFNPFFSPDGQWIGFSTQDKLMKIAVTGGAAVLVADTLARYGATWTEDDRIVFANFGEPLMQVPAGGGEPTIVASLSEERREEGLLWPSVLPGGGAVLVTITTEGLVSTDEALIAAISLETGEQTIVVPGGGGARFVETGHIIYARAGTLRAVGFDPETLRVREPSVQVLEGLSTNRTNGAGLFAAAGNGTLVYVPGGPDPDSALVWVDRQGNVTPAVEAREGF